MIAWFRTFVRRHLIADDPWPQYSRLDHANGLHNTPLSTREQIAGIEVRLEGDRNGSTGVAAQSVKDRAYLLSLVRDQAARLEAVAGLVEQAEKSGNSTLYTSDVHAAITERAAA